MTVSEHPPLEVELSGFAETVRNPRDHQLVLRLMGWDGQGGSSLRLVAREFGLSHERAHQVSAPVVETLNKDRPAPVLDRALAFVREHADRLASEVEADLQAARLTRHRFRLEGLVKTARAFGRPLGFAVEPVGGNRFALTDTDAGNSILSAARHNVSRWGALTVSHLCRQTTARKNISVSDHLVRQVLETQPDFRWIDQSSGWFWLTAVSHNRLLHRVRKILCVAARIRIAEMHAAIYADTSMRGFPLSTDLLLRFCGQIPGCRAHLDYVEATIPIEPATALSEAEAIAWRVLNRHGGTLHLSQFRAFCLDEGVSHANFWRIARQSSLVRRRGPGVYELVGQGSA